LVGRFVEKKGFAYALQAIAQVVAQGVDCQVTLVGDGPLKADLQAGIAKLGLQERVRMPGVLTGEEIHEEFYKADIMLAPSVVAADGDRESGLIVLKEAAATGLPAIGTWHGGLPEIIAHKETGYLVAERDADAIAEHLLALAQNYDLRKTLGLAARKKMEAEYNNERQNEILEGYFLELIQG
jgi:colanic acid/amylovoran biosynthesis glycosyltransferase